MFALCTGSLASFLNVILLHCAIISQLTGIPEDKGNSVFGLSGACPLVSMRPPCIEEHNGNLQYSRIKSTCVAELYFPFCSV